MSNKTRIMVMDLLAGGIYETNTDLYLLVSLGKEDDAFWLKWYSLKHNRLVYGLSCYGHNTIYGELIASL